MVNSNLDQFNKQKYINVETFRKSGVGVQTPVWFVRDGDVLFVRTVANSGKMKRLRNNSEVKVAICDMRGGLLGQWYSGQAEIVKDPVKEAHVNALLTKKYGLLKRFLDWRAKSKTDSSGTMQIKLTGEQESKEK